MVLDIYMYALCTFDILHVTTFSDEVSYFYSLSLSLLNKKKTLYSTMSLVLENVIELLSKYREMVRNNY